jgi:putative endonuclease
MPYVYLLECSDHTYYVGSTINIEKRIIEHNSGIGAVYTKKRLPVNLVYIEQYMNIDDAYRRERQLHGWGHQKKKALIDSDINQLHDLAECKNSTHYK